MSGLVKMDEFIQSLLEEALQADLGREWYPASELDVDSSEHLPYVAHDEISDGQTSNGPGLFVVDLTLSAYHTGKVALNALTDDLYTVVHGWEGSASGVVAGVGHVTRVRDVSLFSTPPGVSMIGKTVRQSNGIFALTIHAL